ncbi:hypothetical protein [Mucilaginibacter gossypii]|uniref:Uncharacterized protein n=1 Tax=Mucilaginibacter gossypii TaxID=551996 RepID=A0A1G8CXQ6_9SPHI|nr:hypothetical protein [Mucilaginibacter gossypii]SDH49899.1 hypothetical protein SAMN05192573_11061 [Mucilaginibacter gossypii]
MKTAEKNAKQVQGTNAQNNAPRTENRPSLTGKEAKQDETAKDEKPAEAQKAEATPTAEVKAGSAPAMDNQPANPAPYTTGQGLDDAPKTEEAPKAEIKYVRPALNLEQTVKVVESLNRKNIQRLALIARIKTLEDFQIKLAENGDQLESNVYQGCKLIIEDDKRNQFVTNTPNLIALVAQFVYDACVNKLSEIEAEIVFPHA